MVEKFHLYPVIVSLYRSDIRANDRNESGEDFFQVIFCYPHPLIPMVMYCMLIVVTFIKIMWLLCLCADLILLQRSHMLIKIYVRTQSKIIAFVTYLYPTHHFSTEISVMISILVFSVGGQIIFTKNN